jgi:hypothetical protein
VPILPFAARHTEQKIPSNREMREQHGILKQNAHMALLSGPPVDPLIANNYLPLGDKGTSIKKSSNVRE